VRTQLDALERDFEASLQDRDGSERVCSAARVRPTPKPKAPAAKAYGLPFLKEETSG